MNCPFYGGEMAEGTFYDRGDSYFLPAGEVRPGIWTKGILREKHAVLLPPEAFGAPFAARPAAFWCGACRRLLVDYSALMPTAEE